MQFQHTSTLDKMLKMGTECGTYFLHTAILHITSVIFFSLALQTNAGYGFLVHKVS
jgi:hypothetical protein